MSERGVRSIAVLAAASEWLPARGRRYQRIMKLATVIGGRAVWRRK